VRVYTRALLKELFAQPDEHEYVLYFNTRIARHLCGNAAGPGGQHPASRIVWDQVSLRESSAANGVDVLFNPSIRCPDRQLPQCMGMPCLDWYVMPGLHGTSTVEATGISYRGRSALCGDRCSLRGDARAPDGILNVPPDRIAPSTPASARSSEYNNSDALCRVRGVTSFRNIIPVRRSGLSAQELRRMVQAYAKVGP